MRYYQEEDNNADDLKDAMKATWASLHLSSATC